jgi:hypothetical protein
MLVATYVVLAGIGVLLGAIEAFLVPQRLFGGIEGLSVVLAVIGNAGLGTAAGVATRSFMGALVPVAAWFVTVGFVSSYAPGGDVVLPGRLPADPGIVHVATAFLLLGVVSGAAGLVATSYFTRRANRPTSVS